MSGRDMRARWDEKWAAFHAAGQAGRDVDRPPHPLVAALVAPLAPGRALDLGAGDGRHTVFLADAGWTVTAVDFSPVAIDHLRETAVRRFGHGAPIEAVVGDATVAAPDGPFDLVLVAFVHLPTADRRQLLALACDRLSPGGRLAVVGHHLHNVGRGTGGTQDATVLCTERDLADELLALGLAIERAEAVERAVDGLDVAALDLLVVARRP